MTESSAPRSYVLINRVGAPLEPRHMHILKLMAKGLQNKEMVKHVRLSINSIQVYSQEIYKRLGALNRTQAVAIAYELGLLKEQNAEHISRFHLNQAALETLSRAVIRSGRKVG